MCVSVFLRMRFLMLQQIVIETTCLPRSKREIHDLPDSDPTRAGGCCLEFPAAADCSRQWLFIARNINADINGVDVGAARGGIIL